MIKWVRKQTQNPPMTINKANELTFLHNTPKYSLFVLLPINSLPFTFSQFPRLVPHSWLPHFPSSIPPCTPSLTSNSRNFSAINTRSLSCLAFTLSPFPALIFLVFFLFTVHSLYLTFFFSFIRVFPLVFFLFFILILFFS